VRTDKLSIYRYQPEQFLVDYSVIKLLLINFFLLGLITTVIQKAPISDELIFYIMWPSHAIITILIAHSIANQSGTTFKTFVGRTPLKSHRLELLITLGLVIALGIGGAGLQTFIESNINFNAVVVKMAMVTKEEFQPLNTNNTILLYVTAVAIVPIFEEIFFRGLLLGSLRKKYSDRLAILLSAFIFAAFHFNKLYINTFISGIIFALIVIRFGSLYYSIIAHGIWNLFAQVAQNEYGYFKAFNLDRLTEFSYWLPEISTLIVGLAASYWFFFHFKPKDKPLDNLVVP